MCGREKLMIQEKNGGDWRCSGQTIQGASHVRVGLTNQDAIRWWPGHPEIGSGPPIILVVSDGHGSAKSFRSHIGARIAVDLATEVIGQFFHLDDQPDELNANFSMINDTVQRRLPEIIVSRWQSAVENQWKEAPFTDEEWASLEKKHDPAACLAVEKSPTLAYGATLLAVVVTENFFLYLQLGDGDIVCVDTNGQTTQPFPPDERLIANETTSLCMPNAWREVRVRLVPYSEDPPALILVSTDGYDNSFRSKSDFFKVGQDYREMIRSRGIDHVVQQLTSILEDTSQQGSGDDITLGIIKRIEKGDVDYVESAFEAEAKARVELQNRLEEHMTKQQEDISNVDSRLEKLDASYNKLRKGVERLLYGLLITFFLAIGSIAVDIWLCLQLRNKEPTQSASTRVQSPAPSNLTASSREPASATSR